jgi:hypothetical protein
MLGNCHELNRVIAKLRYSWKDVGGKLLVGADPAFLDGHSHMRLIDSKASSAPYSRVLPLKSDFGVPILAGEACRACILNDPSDIGRNPVERTKLRDHVNLDPAFVNQAIAHLSVGKENRPHSPLIALKWVRASVPSVKIANQEQRVRGGRPLPVPNAFFVASSSTI